VSIEEPKYPLRCLAPHQRNVGRTCGLLLAESPVAMKWVGAFQRKKDDEGDRLSIRCWKCKRFNMFVPADEQSVSGVPGVKND
jgi:hypothetical protein